MRTMKLVLIAAGALLPTTAMASDILFPECFNKVFIAEVKECQQENKAKLDVGKLELDTPTEEDCIRALQYRGHLPGCLYTLRGGGKKPGVTVFKPGRRAGEKQ